METPENATIPVTPAGKDYIEALHKFEVLPRGDDAQLDGQVDEILRALHVALAGGQVNVEIADRGTSAIAEELDGLLAAAVNETKLVHPNIAYF